VDLDGNTSEDARVDVGDGKVAGLYARDGNVLVSESGGLGISGGLTFYGDGDLSNDVDPQGTGYAIRVLVDGFRISPF